MATHWHWPPKSKSLSPKTGSRTRKSSGRPRPRDAWQHLQRRARRLPGLLRGPDLLPAVGTTSRTRGCSTSSRSSWGACWGCRSPWCLTEGGGKGYFAGLIVCILTILGFFHLWRGGLSERRPSRCCTRTPFRPGRARWAGAADPRLVGAAATRWAGSSHTSRSCCAWTKSTSTRTLMKKK